MERVFWRVTDDSSAVPYLPRYGFSAGIKRSPMTLDPEVWTEYQERKLKDAIRRHLDWSYRRPTLFVSVYSDYSTAEREAWRRMRAGMRDVTIWEIRVPQGDNDGWRMWKTVNRLQWELGFWIEDRAFHNAKYEALFLHRIPSRYVVGKMRFTNHRGQPIRNNWFSPI